MGGKGTYYITTAIAYTSRKPHIGNTYEVILTDAIARMRRAQGYDGAMYGARAAYIGGCVGTACTIVDREFGIPALGTMAHSWVMSFDHEIDAFREYVKCYHENLILLADTYNVLEIGVPDAITVFHELKAQGKLPKVYGIRIDSGDLAYLSKKAKAMLDAAGFTDDIISASNDLD